MSIVDFQMPAPDDPRRLAVRQWLADHPSPSTEALAHAGYVAPHWPAPWGIGADPILQVIVDEELTAAAVRRPINPIGIGWAGPTLLYAGTQAQQERYLFPILTGADYWCQLFSEPDAGSDLASLTARAVRDGDEFVVNGQKIWTSGAQFSRYGILLARTDPDAPKHQGISYFVCPMDAPGIEIRPITEMTGGHTFNEVFLTDARIPAENLVGELNDGWRLAKVTLGNERVSLSSGGVLWGGGPTTPEVIEAIRRRGPVTDRHARQRIARLYTEYMLLELIRMRTLTARLRGEQPGPEASIRKILADEHGQLAMDVAREMIGSAALLTSGDGSEAFVPSTDMMGLGPGKPPLDLSDPAWYDGYLFSQALTIGGGTGDVQRNIVAERVLGLPPG